MKANELMIGDWVKLMNPKGECIDYVKIDANLFGIFLRDGEEGFVRFEPIPLTPEILEKNGFEKICLKFGQVIYSLADDYYDLEAEEITDSIWRIEYFNVEASFPSCRELVSFVHEIQHFLNSHKIEKEIEL